MMIASQLLIPIAKLISWSQLKFTMLIVNDYRYCDNQNPPNLNDFVSETSKSEDIRTAAHSPKGDKAYPRHCVEDERPSNQGVRKKKICYTGLFCLVKAS